MLAQMSARDAMLLVDYVVYISTGLLLLHWTYRVNPLVFAEAYLYGLLAISGTIYIVTSLQQVCSMWLCAGVQCGSWLTS